MERVMTDVYSFGLCANLLPQVIKYSTVVFYSNRYGTIGPNQQPKRERERLNEPRAARAPADSEE